MCGIAGVLAKDSAANAISSNVLEALRGGLRHRGPDDEGQFISADGHAALVHTRLSVLDLTSAGHQPMHSADGRYSITFNGEIYNFLELRCELQRCGEIFRTRTDTEVLLRLYARLGSSCVGRLRGMFAFAIWDAAEQSCFLARDLFGIKPLYYHHGYDRFVFASEIRALLEAGVVPRRLNPAGVAGYFQHGTVPEPETLLQDVRCLEAGHSLLWKAGSLQEQEYGSIRFAAGPWLESNGVQERVRAALRDSVEHHFLSDVPVGIFLSGGIDSTALLALASMGERKNIRTFSIRFAERDFDEGDVAKRSADHFGSTHAEWQLNAPTGRRLFRDFLQQLDQPTIDGFNTFVVSKFARDEGMKVVLSGLGGDELFGSYPSFRDVPQLLRAARYVSNVGPVAWLGAAALERLAPKEPWRRLGHFLRSEPNVRAAYHAYRAVFMETEANRLALGYTRSLPARWQEHAHIEQPTVGDEVSVLELSEYMRNQLLRDSDVMSMAWGLELRVPFIDQPLIEQLSNVPAGLRLHAGKKLLLETVPEIPPWVVGRPKQGFTFPFRRWLDSEWEGLFQNIGVKFGVRSRTWYQKWAIFVFEHWCREHAVN